MKCIQCCAFFFLRFGCSHFPRAVSSSQTFLSLWNSPHSSLIGIRSPCSFLLRSNCQTVLFMAGNVSKQFIIHLSKIAWAFQYHPWLLRVQMTMDSQEYNCSATKEEFQAFLPKRCSCLKDSKRKKLKSNI